LLFAQVTKVVEASHSVGQVPDVVLNGVAYGLLLLILSLLLP
jgi:hypothetical protein